MNERYIARDELAGMSGLEKLAGARAETGLLAQQLRSKSQSATSKLEQLGRGIIDYVADREAYRYKQEMARAKYKQDLETAKLEDDRALAVKGMKRDAQGNIVPDPTLAPMLKKEHVERARYFTNNETGDVFEMTDQGLVKVGNKGPQSPRMQSWQTPEAKEGQKVKTIDEVKKLIFIKNTDGMFFDTVTAKSLLADPTLSAMIKNYVRTQLDFYDRPAAGADTMAGAAKSKVKTVTVE